MKLIKETVEQSPYTEWLIKIVSEVYDGEELDAVVDYLNNWVIRVYGKDESMSKISRIVKSRLESLWVSTPEPDVNGDTDEYYRILDLYENSGINSGFDTWSRLVWAYLNKNGEYIFVLLG